MLNRVLSLIVFLTSVSAFGDEPALIKADGSSTVFPITEAASYEYQKTTGTRVTVGISGTGGGFKKFCAGETDVQNASRPISKEEMAKCAEKGIKYIELPVAYDALVVVVNPKNDWLQSISVDELKKIWEPAAKGTILTWKQVNPAWPDEKLVLFGPGTDSGTFDYFTEAINGKAKSSRPDYSASEDDNTLVTGVAGNKGAMGYFGFSYYDLNKSKLKAIPVIGGEKAPLRTPVAPSHTTVKDGTYFPLSRPLFIYVSESSMKSKPEVKNFAAFYVKESARFAEKAKYIALPTSAYKIASEHLEHSKLGTVFNGDAKVGMKIEELLKLETKL